MVFFYSVVVVMIFLLGVDRIMIFLAMRFGVLYIYNINVSIVIILQASSIENEMLLEACARSVESDEIENAVHQSVPVQTSKYVTVILVCIL